MNLNKGSLYIGVVALLLAVPLSIIANLLTPPIREWYSATNQKRLRKRVGELEEKLRASEAAEWTFTPAEWLTYRTAVGTNLLIILTLHLILGCLVIAVWAYRGWVPVLPAAYHPPTFRAATAVAMFGMGFNAGLFQKILKDSQNKRDMHSIVGRNKMKAEIARLKARLK
jgi:hypothetical protein